MVLWGMLSEDPLWYWRKPPAKDRGTTWGTFKYVRRGVHIVAKGMTLIKSKVPSQRCPSQKTKHGERKDELS